MATPLPIPFSFLTRGATASVFIRRCSSTITLSRSHLHSKFASRETALKSSAISRPITGRHPRQSRLVSSSKPNNTFKTAAKVESSALDSGEHASQASMTMWQRFLAPKPMPERHTATWYREMLLICTVFGITGSSTMLLVRPAVSDGLGIKGSFRDGPWSYRISSIVIMTPIYATLLVGVGTVFGRHAYFRHFSVKIFSRFGIPPEALDKNFHLTKKNFRKW